MKFGNVRVARHCPLRKLYRWRFRLTRHGGFDVCGRFNWNGQFIAEIGPFWVTRHLW